MSKNFLVPIGLAASALLSNNSEAMVQTNLTKSNENPPDILANSVDKPGGLTMHIVEYIKGNEKHELFMKKSNSGLIFADHRSHGSHGSHGSHRSGY